MDSTIGYITELLKTNFNTDQAFKAINKIIQNRTVIFPNKHGEGIIVTFINKLIFTTKHSFEGYKLLNNVVFDISEEFIFVQSSKWIINILSKECDNIYKMEVLVKLLKICGGNQEFDKFIHPYVTKIIDLCLINNGDYTYQECTANCLSFCIQMYPKMCRSMKDKIEAYLHKCFYMDMPIGTSQAIGKVFSKLPKMDSVPAHAWSSLFHKFCSTLHTVYDKLLDSVTEFRVTFKRIDITTFEFKLDQDNAHIVLKNCVRFMVYMLSDVTDHEKLVMVQLLLDVIRRGLAVDLYDQSTNSLRIMKFVKHVYEHQVILLNLLKTTVIRFKSNLHPYASQLTKLLIDCQRRSFKEYFVNQSDYQKELYETFSCWLTVGGNTLGPIDQNNFMENALKHISVTEVPYIPKHYIMVKEEVCEHALKSCTVFFQTVTLQASVEVRVMFVHFVFSTLSVIPYRNDYHPYTNLKCIINLYKLLHGIFCQPCYSTIFVSAITTMLYHQKQFHLKLGPEVLQVVNDTLYILRSPAYPCTPETFFSHSYWNSAQQLFSVHVVNEMYRMRTPVIELNRPETHNHSLMQRMPIENVHEGIVIEPFEENVASVVHPELQAQIEDIGISVANEDKMVSEESGEINLININIDKETEINFNNTTASSTVPSELEIMNIGSLELNESHSDTQIDYEESGESSSEAEAYVNSFRNSVYDA